MTLDRSLNQIDNQQVAFGIRQQRPKSWTMLWVPRWSSSLSARQSHLQLTSLSWRSRHHTLQRSTPSRTPSWTYPHCDVTTGAVGSTTVGAPVQEWAPRPSKIRSGSPRKALSHLTEERLSAGSVGWKDTLPEAVLQGAQPVTAGKLTTRCQGPGVRGSSKKGPKL